MMDNIAEEDILDEAFYSFQDADDDDGGDDGYRKNFGDGEEEGGEEY